MEDLPPEGASEEELEKAAELLAAIYQHLEEANIKELPDWYHYFRCRGTLVKFLRGREGNVEKAKKLMLKAMQWFHEVGYWDGWIRKYEQDPFELHKIRWKYRFSGIHGVDKRGAPVTYLRIGLADTAGLIEKLGREMYFRSQVYGLEALSDAMWKASLKQGVYLIGTLTVMDASGASYGRTKSTVEMLIYLTKAIMEDHFPESGYAIVVVNMPWYYNWAWKLISPFLPARTLAKVQICGSDFMSTLEEYVDKSEIPAFLGGDSKEPWTGGKGGDLPDKADKGGPKAVHLGVPLLAHDVSFQAEVDGTAVEAPRKVTAEEGWV
eukprot:CAMPEP_0180425676 /NCGR_PEP_ID=MMETSP1036_2-20121128/5394_1 /TAXON_ID=632150 /ORGANISM="Azadinium spinosum, Strain 3D9" /LENGTH=322 /DNA_ID=CAMNT_0022431189 /DNA_START=30 /DNA_END=995 /DNA_ORIENTATION=-